MKNGFKTLFALSAAMAVLLSACGGGSPPSPAETIGSSAALSQTSGESGVPDAPESTALQGEKPVLKYLGRDATFDLANNPMIPILEEKTGYTLEFEALPVGDEGMAKLMMLVSSGTPYDIINVAPDHFDRLLVANATLPLDDLLKNAPNVMACIPEDSGSWQRVMSPDGKRSAIPQLNPTGNPVSTIAIRQDLLDVAGLTIPDNAEELYQVLKALQTNYPDMIPLTTDNYFTAQPISSAFNVYSDWYEVDGSLVPNQKREAHREYIAYMNRLYAEGLLDKEFPANDAATRLKKFTSGKAAATYFHSSEGPGFYSALEQEVPGSLVSYVPFLMDSSGNRGTMATGSGLEKICVIPKMSANPAHAMVWIDAFAANFKDIYIGPEGVDHKVEDGKYLPIMPEFSVHDTVWWFMPLVDEAHVFDWWQARVRKSPEVERGYMDTFAMKADGVTIATPTFEMYPPNEEYIKLHLSLSQYWRDEMVKLVAGAVPMEDYDKIVAKWENDGGTRLIELANEMWKGR
jgi:putative aldouronate transport system substrate-binding protein